jgi:starch phosphorylase
MSLPYKLVAFDLDGTLAESKQPITVGMAELLHKLAQVTEVAVISGGSMARFEDQLLQSMIPSKNIILLPAEGSSRYEFRNNTWERTDREAFPKELKEKVFTFFKEIIADPKYEIPPFPEGEYLEDRDTEIAFSALGQNASLAEKEKWDPTRARRFKIKAAIEAGLPEVVAAVAGTTSIDILPRGFDKAKGLGLFLEKTGLKKEDVLFMGDAVVPGGNDYSVFEAGIKTIKVSGPIETAEAIRALLGETAGEKEEIIHPSPSFPKNPIAYFCSEYALEVNPAMYAGGLGILAADYFFQAGDEDIPFVAIGLRYGKMVPTGFGTLADELGSITVEIPIGVDTAKAKVWHRSLSPNVHMLLLDTAIPLNSEENQKITSHLYDMNFARRVRQQMVLGIGGVRLLKKLGIHPRVYHLNEGHTAFAGIAVMVERPEDLDKIVGTKHTILSAAGLLIKNSDLEADIGPYAKEFGLSFNEIFEKGKFELGQEFFSTTKLVMTLSRKKNAVSALHAVYEKKVHPHSTLISVTNGVYRKRWQAKEFLNRSHELADADLMKIKRKLRLDLFSYIESVSGKKLNPDIATLVWSRRFAGYKRPFLLFSDLRRLTEILTHTERPLQCVISGKAAEGDTEGQDSIEKIIAFSDTAAAKGRVVYLPDYSVASAEKLTRGADIWLNTPELGKEACGTSGMKASLNGALQCSVSDGWVDEVNWSGRGWMLPGDKNTLETAEVLYDLLLHEILPCFYGDSGELWATRMRSTIELVEKKYTADRMLHDYEKDLYTW